MTIDIPQASLRVLKFEWVALLISLFIYATLKYYSSSFENLDVHIDTLHQGLEDDKVSAEIQSIEKSIEQEELRQFKEMEAKIGLTGYHQQHRRVRARLHTRHGIEELDDLKSVTEGLEQLTESLNLGRIFQKGDTGTDFLYRSAIEKSGMDMSRIIGGNREDMERSSYRGSNTSKDFKLKEEERLELHDIAPCPFPFSLDGDSKLNVPSLVFSSVLDVSDYIIDDQQDYAEYHRDLHQLGSLQELLQSKLYNQHMSVIYQSYEYLVCTLDPSLFLAMSIVLFLAIAYQLIRVFARSNILEEQDSCDDEEETFADILEREMGGDIVEEKAHEPLGLLDFLFSAYLEHPIDPTSGSEIAESPTLTDDASLEASVPATATITSADEILEIPQIGVLTNPLLGRTAEDYSYSRMLSVYRSLPYLSPIPSLVYFSLTIFVLAFLCFHAFPFLNLLGFYILPKLQGWFPVLMDLASAAISSVVDSHDIDTLRKLFPYGLLIMSLFTFASVLSVWLCYVQYLNIPLLIERGSLDVYELSFIDFLIQVDYPSPECFVPYSHLVVDKDKYSPHDKLKARVLKEDDFIPYPDSYYYRATFLWLLVIDCGLGGMLFTCYYLSKWSYTYDRDAAISHEAFSLPLVSGDKYSASNNNAILGSFVMNVVSKHISEVTSMFISENMFIIFFIDGALVLIAVLFISLYLVFDWLLHLRFLPFLTVGTDEEDDRPLMPFYSNHHIVPLNRLMSVPFLPTIFKPQRYLCMEPLLATHLVPSPKYIYSQTKFISTRISYAFIKLMGLYCIIALHAAPLFDLWAKLHDSGPLPAELNTLVGDYNKQQGENIDEYNLVHKYDQKVFKPLDSFGGDSEIPAENDRFQDTVCDILASRTGFLQPVTYRVLTYLRSFIIVDFHLTSLLMKAVLAPFAFLVIVSSAFFVYWWNFGRFAYLKKYRGKKSGVVLSSIEYELEFNDL